MVREDQDLRVQLVLEENLVQEEKLVSQEALDKMGDQEKEDNQACLEIKDKLDHQVPADLEVLLVKEDSQEHRDLRGQLVNQDPQVLQDLLDLWGQLVPEVNKAHEEKQVYLDHPAHEEKWDPQVRRVQQAYQGHKDQEVRLVLEELQGKQVHLGQWASVENLVHGDSQDRMGHQELQVTEVNPVQQALGVNQGHKDLQGQEEKQDQEDFLGKEDKLDQQDNQVRQDQLDQVDHVEKLVYLVPLADREQQVSLDQRDQVVPLVQEENLDCEAILDQEEKLARQDQWDQAVQEVNLAHKDPGVRQGLKDQLDLLDQVDHQDQEENQDQEVNKDLEVSRDLLGHQVHQGREVSLELQEEMVSPGDPAQQVLLDREEKQVQEESLAAMALPVALDLKGLREGLVLLVHPAQWDQGVQLGHKDHGEIVVNQEQLGHQVSLARGVPQVCLVLQDLLDQVVHGASQEKLGRKDQEENQVHQAQEEILDHVEKLDFQDHQVEMVKLAHKDQEVK